MTDTEIGAVWIYARQVWPRLFDIPADERERAVKRQVWRDVLGDLDLAVVRAALIESAQDEYPPAPGLLRKRCLRLTAVEGSSLPDADSALAEVYRTISHLGRYGTPEWSHPAIAVTVAAIGGWQEVCNNDNPEAFRAHFVRLYAGAAERVARTTNMPPVVAELLAGAGLDLSAARALEEGS